MGEIEAQLADKAHKAMELEIVRNYMGALSDEILDNIAGPEEKCEMADELAKLVVRFLRLDDTA